jgi:hypothetical protein
MERLKREHARQVAAGALLAVAVVVLVIGYSNIRDEIHVAAQMPYVLTGGVGALILAGLGMVVLRSQDDKAVLDRLNQVESTADELRERVDYLTQLLEAALLPDEVSVAGTGNKVERKVAATRRPLP